MAFSLSPHREQGVEVLIISHSGGRTSRNESGALANLHSLGAALGAELVKEPAGMRLDRVLADKQAAGDFPVAESCRDQSQDLQLAGRNAKLSQACFVQNESPSYRRRDFFDND